MKALITIVVIIALAAVAGSIVVGVMSFDGIVTDNPYETGLLWDEIQNKRDRLGWHVEFHNKEFVTGDNDVLVSVFDINNMPLAGSGVTLSISRPSTGTLDRDFDSTELRDGVFSSHLNFPVFGFWDIDITVSNGDDKLLFVKRVFVNRKEMHHDQ